MSIDWSKAPEGATHYRGSIKTFYKQDIAAYEWDTVEWRMIGTDLGEFRWSSDLIDRPVNELTGECLTPIGSTVRISKDGWEIWDVAEQFIGVDVTLVARFMTGDTEMAAVEHPVIRQCCCFRLDMIRTPEQIAAEERSAFIYEALCCVEKNAEAFNESLIDKERSAIESTIAALYAAGYRKVNP